MVDRHYVPIQNWTKPPKIATIKETTFPMMRVHNMGASHQTMDPRTPHTTNRWRCLSYLITGEQGNKRWQENTWREQEMQRETGAATETFGECILVVLKIMFC